MAQLICKRNSVGYHLLSQRDFSLPQVKSVNYGLKALRYFGPKIWNIYPSNIENSKTLREFSKKVWIHGFLETVLVESVKVTYIK